VTGGWRSSRGLGAEAVASTTLVPAIVERAAIGRATISTQGFGGALLFAWPPAPARWSWFAGAGVLATRVEARGEPRPSFLGSTEAAWGVGPYISAGGSVTLFESLRLRLEAAALRTMNGPTIRFDESEVAIFGQPSLFVSLSLEATVAN
jgi:hypothetical protein